MIEGQEFTNVQFLSAVCIATVPSLIMGLVFWIRLGPRVQTIEVFKAEATAQLKSTEICLTRLTALQASAEKLYTSHDSDLKSNALILARLTTLQEVAERRLERLETK